MAFVTIIGFPWPYLAAGSVLPLLVALLAAWPLWRCRQEIIGSIVGAGLALMLMVGFVGREYVSIEQATAQCVDTDTPCVVRPDAFTRYAAYAIVGFIDIGILFAVGLLAEERRRRRESGVWW